MKKRILVIEDEEILLSLIKKKLMSKGYDVCTATNGEDGFRLIEKEKPDLILLDIIMPVLDGFEVMEKMNQTSDLSLDKIPVIIISNSGQPVEIERAMNMGIKDYLIKTDFDPDEVLAKIEKQF
ncbi:response regulator transcription factor [Candidatus Parcubacteria bacterium]|nr:response regulator transcription factor [Candidatus Parcubacteria bacterium]